VSSDPFQERFVNANGLNEHVVIGGSGETVVLLHGWPLTWRSFSKLLPPLINSGFRAIAPDLRGLGDTEVKGPFNLGSSAEDVYQLGKALGIQRAHLVGHDLGAEVAYLLTARHLEFVKTLTILDVPMRGFGLDEFAHRLHLWHFDFFLWPGAAEAVIPGKEREFFSLFYRTGRRQTISDENRESYLLAYSRPDALRATIGWYRESSVSNQQEVQEASKTRLSIPVLAVGGEYAGGQAPAECMRKLANQVQGTVISGIGHHIPEEAPDELSDLLMEHFRGNLPRTRFEAD